MQRSGLQRSKLKAVSGKAILVYCTCGYEALLVLRGRGGGHSREGAKSVSFGLLQGPWRRTMKRYNVCISAFSQPRNTRGRRASLLGPSRDWSPSRDHGSKHGSRAPPGTCLLGPSRDRGAARPVKAPFRVSRHGKDK